jgi:DNA helicase-2/ATP-dependent DNA helicase PcrA
MKENLNPKQKKAVDCTEGPLLILAGAGAGKTKTIVERIINIIKKGTAPHNILAVTFTNKAAKEMLERVEKRLIEEGITSHSSSFFEKPTIKTFHSLGVLMIKENAVKLGLNRNFTILDTGDTNSIIKEILNAEGVDIKLYEPARFRHSISKYKSDFRSIEEVESGAMDYFSKLLIRVWKKYEEALKKQNSLDFDDLLIKSVNLLEKNPEVLAYYQKRFLYIHIDEYQDTNQVQYTLGKLLAAKNRNICVVGDGDQNIYSWRGANMKNILNFEKDYNEARSILLEENYRSSKNILDAANAVIKINKERHDKNLFTQKEEGEKIFVAQNYDEKSEGSFVALECKKIIGEGFSPDDIAILYRANFQSSVMENSMIAHNVPYMVLGTKFFERREIKDTISYLRVALNRESLPDMKRTLEFPKRGIGKVTLIKIFQGLSHELPTSMQKKIQDFWNLLDRIKEKAETLKLSETLEFIIKESGIEKELTGGGDEDKERFENVRELVSLATKYDDFESSEAIDKFLEESALISDQDNADEKKAGVRLMTVHASKGLEFKAVFVVGLEQDLFPHIRIGAQKQSKEEKEEERRLFYVAITRARERLYLTYADIRTIYGNRQITIPSEFIFDLPDHTYESVDGVGREYLNKVVYLDF